MEEALTWLRVQEGVGSGSCNVSEELEKEEKKERVRTIMSGKVQTVGLTSVPAEHMAGIG